MRNIACPVGICCRAFVCTLVGLTGKRTRCRIAILHGQCAVNPMAGQMTTTFRTHRLGLRTSFLGDRGHRACPLPAAKRGAARHHRPCVVASMTASDSGLTKQQMAILGMASRLPESHAEPSPVWPTLPTVAKCSWTTMAGGVMLCCYKSTRAMLYAGAHNSQGVLRRRRGGRGEPSGCDHHECRHWRGTRAGAAGPSFAAA